jgi:hypothetical protein
MGIGIQPESLFKNVKLHCATNELTEQRVINTRDRESKSFFKPIIFFVIQKNSIDAVAKNRLKKVNPRCNTQLYFFNSL